jgi:hypothetical protein
MLKFLSKLKASSAPAKVVRPAKPAEQPESPSEATLPERRRFTRPLPTPEVHEGDGCNADWNLWVELSKQHFKK